MLKIVAIRHSYPEGANFTINRTRGHENYTFLHFVQPVKMLIKGETFVTQPHACIIYEPRFPQYFHSEQPFEHDWIHFDGISSEKIVSLGLPLNEVFYPSQHEFITQLTREMQIEQNAENTNKQRMIECIFDELLIKLQRSAFGQIPEPIPVSLVSALRVVREKVFLSLNQKHTVKSMADGVGLSESRFFSVYKSFFGISPMDDLINARIDLAKNLLLGSDKKIYAIAQELGYAEVTHFIRQFRKRTGISPSKYRKS